MNIAKKECFISVLMLVSGLASAIIYDFKGTTASGMVLLTIAIVSAFCSFIILLGKI